MAKQVTVWQTDQGEPAISEADALMGDAGDAISLYADKHEPGSCGFDFDLGEWLVENHAALLPLLQAYADAKAKRHAEIYGERT